MKNKYSKNEQIYKSKPLSYRQWGQIRKEMYKLVWVVAALVAANSILYMIAIVFVKWYASL